MQYALAGVALTLASLTPGLAHADAAGDTALGATQLAAEIRARDAAAITRRLADGFVNAGVGFADAACRQRFPGSPAAIPSKELAAFATCLAQLTLQPTTRTHALRTRAALAIDPGLELEVVFVGTKVRWMGASGQRTRRDGVPTLTPQAFEALRKRGSKNVDSAVRAGFARFDRPVSTWVEICLDATGAVTSISPRESTHEGVADRFVAAIQGWQFRGFELHGVATPVCSLSLLTFPAAKAPTIETLPLPLPPPPPPIAKAKLGGKDLPPDEDDEGGVEGGVVGGVIGGSPPPPPPPPPASPQNVAPAALEGSRISGTKLITPDDVTKVEIQQAGKAKLVGAYKLCLDPRGAVTLVKALKSTGFPAYDEKIIREMGRWRYRPFMVNGTAVPVCTAVTFIYTQTLPEPRKP